MIHLCLLFQVRVWGLVLFIQLGESIGFPGMGEKHPDSWLWFLNLRLCCLVLNSTTGVILPFSWSSTLVKLFIPISSAVEFWESKNISVKDSSSISASAKFPGKLWFSCVCCEDLSIWQDTLDNAFSIFGFFSDSWGDPGVIYLIFSRVLYNFTLWCFVLFKAVAKDCPATPMAFSPEYAFLIMNSILAYLAIWIE